MLVTSKEMLIKAQQEGYAVPAINTQGGCYDIIRAICLAAEEEQSPVILAHYLSTGAYSGHDWFFVTAKWMAEHVSVPVAIHLDHGDSFESCVKMLRLGFTSIMYDGSILSVEDNASHTNEVIRAAHAVGVPVEAEIGELARFGDKGKVTGLSNTANPFLVHQYLSLCSPDSIAISIGNAHGFYNGPANLKLNVLKECRAFTDLPFVLHGCTGMAEAQIKEAISYGVAKINFGTQIRYQYIGYVKEGLKLGIDNGHAWKLSQYASDKLVGDVKNIIRLAGSNKRV